MTAEEINNIKYKVCCPLCDNVKCVRGTDKCEAEMWAKQKARKQRNDMNDSISRQAVLEPYKTLDDNDTICIWLLRKNIEQIPSAQPEEVIPHRNYKYLSDYWCECGWHLGKKGEVKYCAECGRKVNWGE